MPIRIPANTLERLELFYGPLLDRFGRKLPLYAGLILFIALRFVQALGGCAAQVSAMA